MDSEKRRKRKLLSKQLRVLVFFCCLIFIFLLYDYSDRFCIPSSKLHRAVAFPSDVALLTSVVDSAKDFDDEKLRVADRVLFPDHVLLFVSGPSHGLKLRHCIYYKLGTNYGVTKDIVMKPVLSIDEYDEFRFIVRCPLPPLDHSVEVEVWRKEMGQVEENRENGRYHNSSVHSWEMVAYEATLDRDTVVVFVKGLNLRQGRMSDPTHYSCHFGSGELKTNETFPITTKTISAAQGAVRCTLPPSIRNNLDNANAVRVAIGVDSIHHGRIMNHTVLPSVAVISRSEKKWKQVKAKYEMCVCTMVWNQAFALREWIMYHSWLGVQRWFIYDNNSDDELKDVIAELQENEYHISRHTWPWVKTQEAGFSHCAIRAKDECNWVGFFDVDEFFYFPVHNHKRNGIKLRIPGKNSLHNLVASFSSSLTIGELRTSCHSFGPSGLRRPPTQGITTGYTCRLQSPERHKSIVRLDALHDSLLNVVHHFHLKKRYRYINVLESKSLINHYKYQVWDVFKAKFYRRVATYVADWQENQNEKSRDRAPGLGTEAIEPSNWHLQFCEVWDTGLRDVVLANLGDLVTGELPWVKVRSGPLHKFKIES